MPVFNGYQFEPLDTNDSLRLIVLTPAKNMTTPLRCSIVQDSRSALRAPYSAVSYTWGPREFTHHLEIEHDGDTSYLKITTNVDILLRYLRDQRVLRNLWIDAICLNQNDDAEKAQQIPLMGCIYGQAQQVHIWLGTDNCTILPLFAFFRAASQVPETKQQIMANRLVFLMRKHFSHTSPDGIVSQLFLPGGGEAFNSISDFFDRPWFSRRWVIQEAHLARQAIVHCGKHSTPMCIVAAAARKFQCMDLSSYPIRMAAYLSQLNFSNTPTLLELLWKFHEARCVDRKDRVAALAGLVSGSPFHLDYTTSWDVMYKQVASITLQSEDNSIRLQILLHLFEFGHLSQLRDVVCPSWIPDWSSCRTRKLPYHTNARNVDNISDYHTPFGCSITATVALNNNVLEVHPDPSNTTAQGWRVFYATRIATCQDNEEPHSDRIVTILQGLFPLNTPESAFEILEISSLLQWVLDFRHSEAKDQRLISRRLELYITEIVEKLPKSIHRGFFDSLWKLDSLLQDACLFALEPLEPGADTSRAYGLCLTQVLSGDIMVPLWHREEKATGFESVLGGWKKNINIITMLGVNHIDKGPELDKEYESEGVVLLQHDTIVVPAVCVMPGSVSGSL